MEPCPSSIKVCKPFLSIMDKPWEIRETDQRDTENTAVFIVYCEDGAVEPAYLRRFTNNMVRVSPVPNFGQHHKQIDKVTDDLRIKGMIEVIDGLEYLKGKDGLQVWCLFDRDKEIGDQKESSFNDSIRNATSKGLHVAWSNDDFELWILLHFEEVDPHLASNKSRKEYYHRLGIVVPQEARKLGIDETLLNVFKNPRFSYYDAMKTERRFSTITMPCLAGKMDLAMQRATALEHHQNHPGRTPSEKAPCTMVHHLVKAILDAGGNSF
jgi:hypothetical protein